MKDTEKDAPKFPARSLKDAERFAVIKDVIAVITEPDEVITIDDLMARKESYMNEEVY